MQLDVLGHLPTAAPFQIEWPEQRILTVVVSLQPGPSFGLAVEVPVAGQVRIPVLKPDGNGVTSDANSRNGRHGRFTPVSSANSVVSSLAAAGLDPL
jgi:hypothetical protein